MAKDLPESTSFCYVKSTITYCLPFRNVPFLESQETLSSQCIECILIIVQIFFLLRTQKSKSVLNWALRLRDHETLLTFSLSCASQSVAGLGIVVHLLHVGGLGTHDTVGGLQDLARGVIGLRPPGLQDRGIVVRLVEIADLGDLVILGVTLRAHTIDHGAVSRMILHTLEQFDLRVKGDLFLQVHSLVTRKVLHASVTTHRVIDRRELTPVVCTRETGNDNLEDQLHPILATHLDTLLLTSMKDNRQNEVGHG
ncbi:hypothetical protein PGQ11_006127 [Apiospora arundinis]|uniref:Uncharacterized protein n=1 Tax=Apiospora arundinis TaxID=335852 RepID=A0ABR2ISI2_9PEZI